MDIRKLMQNQDIMIVLETGANESNQLIPPNNGMKVGRENKMKTIKN